MSVGIKEVLEYLDAQIAWAEVWRRDYESDLHSKGESGWSPSSAVHMDGYKLALENVKTFIES
jgi:hypothetical protein